MALFLKIAIWSALLAYLWHCRAYMCRRNRMSRTDLADQLNLISTIDHDALSGSVSRAKNGAESRLLDWRGAWRHFNEARLMLEIADYAERNSPYGPASIDPILLASVRSSAMQMRVATTISLVKCLLLP